HEAYHVAACPCESAWTCRPSRPRSPHRSPQNVYNGLHAADGHRIPAPDVPGGRLGAGGAGGAGDDPAAAADHAPAAAGSRLLPALLRSLPALAAQFPPVRPAPARLV